MRAAMWRNTRFQSTVSISSGSLWRRGHHECVRARGESAMSAKEPIAGLYLARGS